MREDPFETFMAAFAKAISEASPDEVSRALMERLMTKPDSYNAKTVLQSVMDGAVKRLAEDIMVKVIEERRAELEAQIREQVAAMRFDVRLGDTIAVVPQLKSDTAR